MVVEGEAEVAAETGVAFTVRDLGTSPRASMASRAAFSFAFFALSNTSSCNNQSYLHIQKDYQMSCITTAVNTTDTYSNLLLYGHDIIKVVRCAMI